MANVKKLAILWDKFKELISREDFKFAQEKREKKIKCWYVYILKQVD